MSDKWFDMGIEPRSDEKRTEERGTEADRKAIINKLNPYRSGGYNYIDDDVEFTEFFDDPKINIATNFSDDLAAEPNKQTLFQFSEEEIDEFLNGLHFRALQTLYAFTEADDRNQVIFEDLGHRDHVGGQYKSHPEDYYAGNTDYLFSLTLDINTTTPDEVVLHEFSHYMDDVAGGPSGFYSDKFMKDVAAETGATTEELLDILGHPEDDRAYHGRPTEFQAYHTTTDLRRLDRKGVKGMYDNLFNPWGAEEMRFHNVYDGEMMRIDDLLSGMDMEVPEDYTEWKNLWYKKFEKDPMEIYRTDEFIEEPKDVKDLVKFAEHTNSAFEMAKNILNSPEFLSLYGPDSEIGHDHLLQGFTGRLDTMIDENYERYLRTNPLYEDL